MVAAGGEAMVVGANVGKREEIDRMFKEVMDKWGRVDVLVNNAGEERRGEERRRDLGRGGRLPNPNTIKTQNQGALGRVEGRARVACKLRSGSGRGLWGGGREERGPGRRRRGGVGGGDGRVSQGRDPSRAQRCGAGVGMLQEGPEPGKASAFCCGWRECALAGPGPASKREPHPPKSPPPRPSTPSTPPSYL